MKKLMLHWRPRRCGVVARRCRPGRRTSSRPAGSMSARSAISAGPTSTTRAACRSRRSSATRSRPSISRACRRPGRRARHRAPGARRLQHHLHTSFGFMEPTLKVAEKFPDVKFEHATGFKTRRNVATYNASFYEGRYVIGQIAAKMSKTGVAGYIVSFPIPEVVMGINAFMLGAQSVNPDFKVKIVWVNTWFDPGKEADAAKALFDQGADIIVQHTDSTGAAAGRRGARQARLRPGVRHDQVRAQGAAHRDRRRLGSVLHPARQGGARRHLEVAGLWDGMKEGTVHHGALHQHAGRRCQDGGRDRRSKIKSGELNPFTGPITKQDGTSRRRGRQALPDGDTARHELVRQGRRRQAAAVADRTAIDGTCLPALRPGGSRH